MNRYDRSFDALFNPGAAVDYFQWTPKFPWQPDPAVYSSVDAWWLTEFCRLVYRMDDQLRLAGEVDAVVTAALARIDFQIRTIAADAATSSRAVVFTRSRKQAVGNESLTLLVFRGSNETLDWKLNLQANQQPFPGDVRVHSGFLQGYQSIAAQLHDQGLFNGRLMIAGHSLGAALATLTTAEFLRSGIDVCACYSFGCPRIGNAGFAKQLADLPLYRIVNGCDVVTGIPLTVGPVVYTHPDNAIYIDQHGEISVSLSDAEIQKRQLTYIPELTRDSLKKYRALSVVIDRLRTLSSQMPRYLADHAIANYGYRLADQLTINTGRSP
jgi:predicted lipase